MTVNQRRRADAHGQPEISPKIEFAAGSRAECD
jgi:hypothetical protein